MSERAEEALPPRRRRSVGLVGAGTLSTALARGWNEPIVCTDAGSGRAAALVTELGGEVAAGNADLAAAAEIVVLCHQPASLGSVAAEIDGRARCVVSVLSGVPLAELRAAFPRTPVARVAVNVLAQVRQSAVWYAGGLEGDRDVEAEVLERFGRLGVVRRLDERLFPAAIGVSGVGPAYVSLIVEAQVDAAIRHGLDGCIATDAVLATLAGTAELLRSGDRGTLAFRRAVAAPGGPTTRGLAALERAGLRSAFSAALDAVVEALAMRPPQGPSRGDAVG